MADFKVYEVKLDSGDRHFFGSIAGIYDVLSADAVGCQLENLWNKNLGTPGSVYQNKRARIECVLVRRKKTNRGGAK